MLKDILFGGDQLKDTDQELDTENKSQSNHNDHSDETDKGSKENTENTGNTGNTEVKETKDKKDTVIIGMKKDLKSLSRNLKERDQKLAELEMSNSDLKTMLKKLTDTLEMDATQKEREAQLRKVAEENNLDPDSLKSIIELANPDFGKKTLKEPKETKEEKEEKPAIDKSNKSNEKLDIDVDRARAFIEDKLTEFVEDNPEYEGLFDTEDVTDLLVGNLTNPKYNKFASIEDYVIHKYGGKVKGKAGIEKPKGNISTKVDISSIDPNTNEGWEALKRNPEAMAQYKKDMIEKAKMYY
jgi:hypothetical protein